MKNLKIIQVLGIVKLSVNRTNHQTRESLVSTWANITLGSRIRWEDKKPRRFKDHHRKILHQQSPPPKMKKEPKNSKINMALS